MKENIVIKFGGLNEIIKSIFNTQKNYRDIDFVKKDKLDYWKNECKEHPTNQHCLVYCD